MRTEAGCFDPAATTRTRNGKKQNGVGSMGARAGACRISENGIVFGSALRCPGGLFPANACPRDRLLAALRRSHELRRAIKPFDSDCGRVDVHRSASARPETCRGLPGREVAYHADQSVGAYETSNPSGANIVLGCEAMVIHRGHWIQPVPLVLEAADCVAAVQRGTVVRSSGPVFPMQAPVPQNDALAEKYTEIEYNVNSAPLSHPRRCRPKKDLAGFRPAEFGDEGATISRTPGRDGDESGVVYLRRDIEFPKKHPERCQSFIAKLQEVAEILSAACGELLKKLSVHVLASAAQRARCVRSLPVWQFMNRIVGQKVGHAAAPLHERPWFATKPVKHLCPRSSLCERSITTKKQRTARLLRYSSFQDVAVKPVFFRRYFRPSRYRHSPFVINVAAKHIHPLYRIEWTSIFLAKDEMSHVIGLWSAHRLPLQLRITRQHAFAKVNAKVEYRIEPDQRANPRRRKIVIRVMDAVGVQTLDKQMCGVWTPRRNRHDACIVQIHCDIEMCEKQTQCVQAAAAILKEEIAVNGAGLAQGGGIPRRRQVGRIVSQGARDDAPFLSAASGIATQPAKHQLLLC